MSNHPLSKKQKAQLAQLARAAFNHIGGDSMTDAPGDTASARFANWRHSEQAQACGHASLTTATQDHYLLLRAHFNSLLGRDDKAFTDHLKSGPENDKADPTDTPEKRDQIIHLISAQIEGTKYALGYVFAIAKNKFTPPRISNLNTLTVTQLKQLIFTIKNRVKKAAKETAS